jgi:Xaa-Pro aminopeptidase
MNYPLLRRKRLARLLKDEGVDAFLISNPVNVTYLTGFSGDSSYLVLGKRQTVLVSDGRFVEQIAEECPGLEAHIRSMKQSTLQAVSAVLKKLGLHAVGFESSHVSVAELEALRDLAPGLDWKAGRDRVEKLRLIKDPSEIEEIREAVRIAEKAFAMFKALLRPEDTEKSLTDAMESYIRRAGGKCSSFPAIIAVDERAALPHAPPTDRPIGAAQLLLVDWGASGRFYKSDLTRVLIARNYSAFSRSGRRERADGKLERVYNTVLQAQQAALAAVRPGVKASEVDAAARSVIDAADLGDYFNHGLGHGIGLQVHEGPNLRAISSDVLEPGMVTTIEPGIYLPGWGGVRLEDDVLLTPDGCEVLTAADKDWETSVLEF